VSDETAHFDAVMRSVKAPSTITCSRVLALLVDTDLLGRRVSHRNVDHSQLRFR